MREKEFAFPPVVNTSLREFSESKYGLTLDESKPFRLAYFLWDVSPYLSSHQTADVREFVWRKLNDHSLSEADIKPALEELSRKDVTSQWYGLTSPKLPFEIRDATSLKMQLDTSLVKPAIEQLLQQQVAVTPTEQITEHVTVTITESPYKRMTDLYNEIVMLELALRRLIRERLSQQHGTDWITKIPSDILENWQKRKEDDQRESLEPELELINYADFSDYAKIISKFQKSFNDVFPDNSKAFVALTEINNVGRKRVMHVRSVTDESFHNSMRWIRWVKDQLQRR